jgi:AcrR family transcriptional regulator
VPSDGLNRAQIVRTAIELLDADGVDGLSMRRLGQRLGSGATSVYWHVGNKDNLVGLAADEVFGELDLPDPAVAGWRDALAASSRALRSAIVRHPWLVPVLGSRPDVHGPHVARYQHHSLLACELAGFVGADLDHAGGTVFAFVLGAVWGEAPSPAAPDGTFERARAFAEPFPALLARYDALAGADPAAVREESFEFGLAVVLDGLAARLVR